MKTFEHNETVRLINGFFTPSQRRTLWHIRFRTKQDYGDDPVFICRVEDDTCAMWVARKHVEQATVLDLLVAD